ncbi:uncharacterized protein FOMMEDRAFT_170378 [Fomitiporia mediterranea MF3/22]|uniref:uncharacterized protein n=1 Tax=Fomitiporia mediterranea (strain MF3/22) TaxID=694068 RepID=UPI0004407F68|nr:uncharacterized protein FOMMEDRAFT_170378 [Fomitiporia mediterranea MF3/22]EJC99847.1 hypothetical protein FOMMEDRAFT_170378 [Fomitiporia mediterranea MF3/22]
MLASRAPSSFEPDVEQIVPMFTSIVDAEYLQVIVTCLLVYDILITLDKEAKYFWKRSMNSVHIIFFANRYIGLVTAILGLATFTFHVNHAMCTTIAWVCGLGDWIIIMSIDYILILRVLALYMHNRALSYILKSIFILESAATLAAVIAKNVYAELAIGILDDKHTLCGDFRILPKSLPMINGLLLMFLALYKASQYWRDSASIKGLGLVKVLILDQAIYFLLTIFSLLSLIISSQYLGPNPVVGLVLSELGSPILLCILGSRLLFNLKEAGERGQNMGTSYKVPTLSDIEFS